MLLLKKTTASSCGYPRADNTWDFVFDPNTGTPHERRNHLRKRAQTLDPYIGAKVHSVAKGIEFYLGAQRADPRLSPGASIKSAQRAAFLLALNISQA